MASVVQIVNNALARIGVSAIISLDEDSEAARVANLTYTQLRDDVLSDHVWNFAIKRATLAQNAEAPAFGYTFSYRLPSDCLKLLRMEEVTMTYTIEGKNLLTDEGVARVQYLSRVSDPNEFGAKFVEALSARMASEWAIPLVESSSLQQNMTELYIRKLSDARSVDSQESGDTELIADTWVDSRINYAGSSVFDVRE